MIKVFEYSHLGGSEILQVRYPEIDAQIDDAIFESSERVLSLLTLVFCAS